VPVNAGLRGKWCLSLYLNVMKVGIQRMKQELIFKEIDIVQSQIARYDEQGLKIKGLCVTLAAALTVYGLTAGVSSPFIAIIAIAIGLGWLEWEYRLIQSRFIIRSKIIEGIVNSDNIESYTYSVNRTARGELDKNEVPWKVALTQRQFFIFYCGMSLLGSFFWFITP